MTLSTWSKMRLSKLRYFSYRACDPYNCSPSPGRTSLGASAAAADIFGKGKIAGRVGAVSGALALIIAAYAKRKRIFGIGIEKDEEGNITEENYKPLNEEDYAAVKPDTGTLWQMTDRERFFYAGNQQHFYHSIALMAVPFAAKNPTLTTSFLLAGICLFSGTQYYRSFCTDDDKLYALRPALWLGGLCLVTAWFTFLL